MARFVLKDEAGEIVDAIICPPEQIAAFTPDGCFAEMVNVHDRTEMHALGELRKKRNKLLADCDWTLVPDAPTDKAAWAAYRQALRDLPETAESLHNPVWPTPPS